MINLYGIEKLSLSDFPGHPAAIVFVGGCNLRCIFCHNGPLVRPDGLTAVPVEEVLEFLDKRHRILEGVVVTGGEPTIHKGLPSFLSNVKSMGYLVKLDTNGVLPDVVEKIVASELVDYVALDVKAPPDKYPRWTGADVWGRVRKTALILATSRVPHEYRTTVWQGMLTEEDCESMMSVMEEGALYWLQSFKPPALLKEYEEILQPPKFSYLLELKNIFSRKLDCRLRNYPAASEAVSSG